MERPAGGGRAAAQGGRAAASGGRGSGGRGGQQKGSGDSELALGHGRTGQRGLRGRWSLDGGMGPSIVGRAKRLAEPSSSARFLAEPERWLGSART